MPNDARIVHRFVSTKPARGDSTRVYGPQWNEDHVITGIDQVDNTSDETKNAATATLTNKTLVAPVVTGAINMGTATIGSPGQASSIRLFDGGGPSSSYGFGVSGSGTLTYNSQNTHGWYINGTVPVATLTQTNFNIPITTPSTASNNGALTVAGGAGIGGAVFVGGGVVTAGNLSVGGAIIGSGSSITDVPVSGIASIPAYTFIGNNNSFSNVPSAINISALTLKSSPVSSDIVLIQDSAASNAFKRTTAGALSSVGTVASVNGQTGVLVSYFPPQGRLTLASGTPIMGTSYASINALYYTPCTGDLVPLYDGTNLIPTVFSELGITMGTSDWGANTNYDVFVVNDAGTIRLVTGPAWTTASTRGTGAGTTELERVKGLVFNKQAMSARYSPSGTMSVAARRGTYVGTIHTAGAGSINYLFGSVGAGGVAADFGIWNMYNRAPVSTFVGDNTASWTHTTAATWRPANNSSTIRVSQVRGMDEDPVNVKYTVNGYASAGAIAAVGIGVNSTTAFSGQTMTNNFTSNAIGTLGSYHGLAGLGYTYVTALEYTANSNAANFLGAGGLAYLQTGISAEVWT